MKKIYIACILILLSISSISAYEENENIEESFLLRDYISSKDPEILGITMKIKDKEFSGYTLSQMIEKNFNKKYSYDIDKKNEFYEGLITKLETLKDKKKIYNDLYVILNYVNTNNNKIIKTLKNQCSPWSLEYGFAKARGEECKKTAFNTTEEKKDFFLIMNAKREKTIKERLKLKELAEKRKKRLKLLDTETPEQSYKRLIELYNNGEHILDYDERMKLLEIETPLQSYERLMKDDKLGVKFESVERHIIIYKHDVDKNGIYGMRDMAKFMALSYNFAEYKLPLEERISPSITSDGFWFSPSIQNVGTNILIDDINILNFGVKNKLKKHSPGADIEKMYKNIKTYFIEKGTKRKIYINNSQKKGNMHYSISTNRFNIYIQGTGKDFGISKEFLSKMESYITVEIRGVVDDYGVTINKTFRVPIKLY